jgi:hypothetical protein
MLRVVATVVLPLFVPTGLYLLWVLVLRPEPTDGALRWNAVPWAWLAGAGAALLAIVLFVVTVHFGAPQNGVYVPPRSVNGHIVEGHIEPEPAR